MTKTTTKTAPQTSPKSREELLASVKGLEFQTIEVIGGKQFPKGSRFDCIKVGVSRFGKPYCVISVDGEDKFCDPKNVKALKAMTPAKIALATASLEEAREATLILSGIVKNESERAVLIKHHAWYKPMWFPKALVTVLGEHSDGEQNLYEVPRWKISADQGPDGVKALESLQASFASMLQPKAAPKPVTEVIKKTSATAKSIRRSTGK